MTTLSRRLNPFLYTLSAFRYFCLLEHADTFDHPYGAECSMPVRGDYLRNPPSLSKNKNKEKQSSLRLGDKSSLHFMSVGGRFVRVNTV